MNGGLGGEGFGNGFGGGSFGGERGGRQDLSLLEQWQRRYGSEGAEGGIVQPPREGESTPMGGYLQPAQTYTAHTGYNENWDGEGNMTKTPTGGGAPVAPRPFVAEEQLLARPDLRAPSTQPQFGVGNGIQPLQPNTNAADANARSQSLREFDANRNRVYTEDQRRRSGQAIADKQLMAETRGVSPSYAEIDDTRRAAAAATQRRAGA